MYFLCLSVPPSDQLASYVRAFLSKAAGGPSGNEQDEDADVDGSDVTPEAAARAAARRCLGALDSLNALPRLQGQLWKKSPAKLRLTGYDWRYFVVRNMHIFWWKTADEAAMPEAAGPVGGPLCHGYVNLFANACEVEVVE